MHTQEYQFRHPFPPSDHSWSLSDEKNFIREVLYQFDQPNDRGSGARKRHVTKQNFIRNYLTGLRRRYYSFFNSPYNNPAQVIDPSEIDAMEQFCTERITMINQREKEALNGADEETKAEYKAEDQVLSVYEGLVGEGG